MRENEGYKIISAVNLTNELELVIGRLDTSLSTSFVCWFCRDNGDYFWGTYTDTYHNALAVLSRRLREFLGE